jgi:flagellar hook-length control protein FliK
MTPLTSSLLAGLGGAPRPPLSGPAASADSAAPSFSALLREQAKAPSAPPPQPAPAAEKRPEKAADKSPQHTGAPPPAEGKTAEARARQNEAAQKKAKTGSPAGTQAKPAADGDAARDAAAPRAANQAEREPAGDAQDPAASAEGTLPGGEGPSQSPLTPGQAQAAVQALLGEAMPADAAAQAALAQGAAPGPASALDDDSLKAAPGEGGGAEALKGSTAHRGAHDATGVQAAGGSAADVAVGRPSRGEEAVDGRQSPRAAEQEDAAAPSFAARLEQAQALPAESLRALHGAPGSAAAETQAARNSPATTLAQPLHSPEFAPEMAARVSVLAAEGVQRAELHLNPAEMGPVQVQIVVDGQQAQISFMSDQAETRSVLERSLPELATALRDSGLTLSGGGVFQQPREQRDPSSQQQSGEAQGRGAGHGEAGGTAAGTEALTAAPRPAARTRGVVDVYA